MLRPVEFIEIRCKSALNRVEGLPFRWSLNPYAGCVHACQFCYARAFYARAGHGDAGPDFETRILVKVNFPAVLAAELRRPTWRRETVAVGTATDPYQPAEARFRLTRGALERLAAHRTPISLLTKSPLIQRDVDVLASLARAAGARVHFSITTVDLTLWRTVEPGTANPFKRLDAMRLLRKAGVPAGVFMAPVLPGITDSEASIEAVAAAARDHGAAFFDATPLRLMPVVKEHYLGFVEKDFPDLTGRYIDAYPSVRAPSLYRQRLHDRVARVRARVGFPEEPPPPSQPLDSEPACRQLALTL